ECPQHAVGTLHVPPFGTGSAVRTKDRDIVFAVAVIIRDRRNVARTTEYGRRDLRIRRTDRVPDAGVRAENDQIGFAVAVHIRRYRNVARRSERKRVVAQILALPNKPLARARTKSS